MNPVVLIPARFGSSRLPGKPLAPIHGEPMIVHVWRRAVEADLGPVIVATDHAGIAAAIASAGGTAVMTRADHPSGTDRIAEALATLDPAGRHDVVALSAGFMLSGHEDAPLQAGSTKMLFYIAGRSAFAHDNAAAIATFGHESSVTAHLPGPRGISAVDHFSLQGFSGAYAALAKSCPAP